MLCLNLKQARPKHEILTAHRKIQIVMNSKKKKRYSKEIRNLDKEQKLQ